MTRAKDEVSASLEELRDVAHGHLSGGAERPRPGAWRWSRLAARAAVPVQLDVDLPERPPEAVEVAAYYVVSEALANIGKHSPATSATVGSRPESGRAVMVDISDDGVGGTEPHARGRACAGWPIGSRPSAAGSRSPRPRPAGAASRRRSHVRDSHRRHR